MREQEKGQRKPLEEMRYQRKMAAAFAGIAIATGGTFVLHEVQNHRKVDFLTFAGAAIFGGSYGFGSRHLEEYRAIKKTLRDDEE